ncbi:MAG TPA: PilW family protein [Candidatus Accumulibacter phosphatis]|nr:MAG: Tfp pilus assembly protein PilW [Candidatus Accumulibacter sp. SK-11]HAY26555.1 prepilin-type cleavage/methylation domain-containing protein [Accumulibacter sp.]HCN67607.1 prepilin-type N-terminal cleavage/methylation domain-containing protein [Accumulibacter sp.]HRL75759.1 PilW family protein [Candidatus Accumulibacter phosphatis]HRQ94402.1 PilW family protein [Candidatus Accumulibacter phosphatis]
MKTLPLPVPRSIPRGFTLVEVMVAMVIGMIGMIIMLQVFSAAEGQRRSTTGTGDSQSSGAIATYALQRDIRQAGFGFNALNALGCPLTLPAPASRTLAQLAPVVINPPTTDIPAGDANSDTLLITFGSGNGSPEGDVVTAVLGLQLGLQAAGSFTVGDRVIAGPSVPTVGCALTLAAVTAVTPPVITVPSSGAVDGGTLFNLGQNPRILAYAIRAGNLTVCDYMAANCGAACTATDGTCSASWVPIVNNVAALRAQYGHASTATSGVDTWDQATPQQPSPANQDALACSWARTSAVRIVVVARNSQVDRDQITQQAPVWAGSGGAAINLSARANWQNYRYRTFETVIPIRNLPWMATC